MVKKILRELTRLRGVVPSATAPATASGTVEPLTSASGSNDARPGDTGQTPRRKVQDLLQGSTFPNLKLDLDNPVGFPIWENCVQIGTS